jgi:hypothetical protein
MISKTIALKLSKETPKITLTTNTGFEKIEMLEVIGNQINKLDAPLGIRWTLVCANIKYDCFCWQLPGKFKFNCFELMDVFGFIDTDLAKKYVANQPSELHIRLEDREFEEGMEIGIRLGVGEIGKEWE